MSLPRVNSRTPLQPMDDHKPLPLNFAHILATLHPRKHKQRSTFIALIILISLSTYVFIANSASFSPAQDLRRTDSAAAEQLALALETIQNSRLAGVTQKHGQKGGHLRKVPLKLDRAQELAAVSSFLASLPQNVIPPSVDPSKPIDPSLVLDFDTRGPRANEEVQAMVQDVWLRNPVFLYSKMYSSTSRELKSILSELQLHPPPTIIDVDVRDDVDVLVPMLARLTSSPALPVLLIGGTPIHASVEKIKDLRNIGELQKLITAAGSLINGAKRKKNRK